MNIDTNPRFIQLPESLAEEIRFHLWFDRGKPTKPVPELEGYCSKSTWISLRQVPSLFTRKNAHRVFLKKNHELAMELGVTHTDSKGKLFEVKTLNEFMTKDSGFELEPESFDTEINLGEPIDPEGWQQPKKTFPASTLIYDDYWKIIASRFLNDVRGAPQPELIVWYGDLYRITDPISPKLLKEIDDRFSGKSSIPITDIKDPKLVLGFLMKHTHWGHMIERLCIDPDYSKMIWAKRFKKRLKSFLEGGPDPAWNDGVREKFFEGEYERRPLRKRVLRLLEVLKTVMGMFLQRYLAFPEEVWNWRKFDIFILKNLSVLITDEFFDGETNKEICSIVTFYSSLKRARKLYKSLSMRERLDEAELERETPRWLRQFLPVWKESNRRELGFHKTCLIGILSQTRGCGTPPLIDMLKSERKFFQTVAEEPRPMKESKDLIKITLTKLLSELPDHAFTGLSTKAAITLTTSSCLESKVKEGGTIEAISLELLKLGPAKIPITDLYTGKVTSWADRSEMGLGEQIFWHSVAKVLRTSLDELTTVELIMIKEPGKARTVTKGSAYLKVILDLVNKICSDPLKKAFPSSTSGMSKESHGWELFKLLYEQPSTFKSRTEKVDINNHEFRLKVIYDELYLSSTDYETATDYLQFEIAEIIGTRWMQKCGIPPVLQGIVRRTCFRPRKIIFKSLKQLEDIGEPGPDGTRFVISKRGVLMGDPLTKPCLHLVNVLTRYLANALVTDGLPKSVAREYFIDTPVFTGNVLERTLPDPESTTSRFSAALFGTGLPIKSVRVNGKDYPINRKGKTVIMRSQVHNFRTKPAEVDITPLLRELFSDSHEKLNNYSDPRVPKDTWDLKLHSKFFDSSRSEKLRIVLDNDSYYELTPEDPQGYARRFSIDQSDPYWP